MKIRRLEIKAFGPFTDLTLDFTDTVPDLHIIYGANEAGKSSALRALKAWLFGFPERITDDFLHPRNQLLVGGEVQEGENSLIFFRRKKRKGDITGPDGEILDPSCLVPFLGNLERSLFETVYGIDHPALVEGGRDILQQRGALGEILFSAGTGLTYMHGLVQDMEQERDSLYKRKGRNPRINQRLTRHQILRKELLELSLQPEKWEQLAQRLEQIDKELEQLTKKKKSLLRNRNHLERLQRAIPLFANKRRLLRQLEQIGSVPVLPDSFRQQRVQLQQELAQLRQELELTRIHLEKLKQRVADTEPDQHLLLHREKIETFAQRFGAYTKARDDYPRLQGMRTAKLGEARHLLHILFPEMELDQRDPLLGLLQRKHEILDLQTQHVALVKARQDCQQRLDRKRAELKEAEDSLRLRQKPGQIESLRMAIKNAQRAGDLDERISELRSRISTLRQKFQRLCLQQRHWQGKPDEVTRLELPLHQSVRLFAEEADQLEREQQMLDQQRQERMAEHSALEGRLRELHAPGDLPSPRELDKLRARRDSAWRLICRNWLKGEDVEAEARQFDPLLPLHESFAGLIHKTDQLSDRLRLEADRIQQEAVLQGRLREIGLILEDLEEQKKRLRKRHQLHLDAWRILWQPLDVQPDPPAAMSAWLELMEQLQAIALEIENHRNQLATLLKQRQHLQKELTKSLAVQETTRHDDENLEELLHDAEAVLQRLRHDREAYNRLQQNRDNLNRQVRQETMNLGQIEKDLEAWQRQWQQTLGFSSDLPKLAPEQVRDVLQGVENIVDLVRSADELASRMRGIERDASLFEQELESILDSLAPDLKDEAIDQRVHALQQRLAEASETSRLKQRYIEELEETQQRLQQVEQTLALRQQAMRELQELAGCVDPNQLVQIEENVREHKRLRKALQEVEEQLCQLCDENRQNSLEQEALQMDSDGLPGEIEEIERRITRELEPRLRELAEERGRISNLLDQMDGSDAAARKAEELQANLLRMRQDAEQFVRMHLGAVLLRHAMEIYRQQNQAPVLSTASDLFARLTLNAFTKLQTDVDDRGQPILTGIRAGSGQTVLVEQMSSGTRDQLYLALRLASLEHRLKRDKNIPFIVDDILINFDDARTRATIEVLAELAGSMQIILFTHHRLIVREALRAKLCLHKLP